jgi:hypothetical protein
VVTQSCLVTAFGERVAFRRDMLTDIARLSASRRGSVEASFDQPQERDTSNDYFDRINITIYPAADQMATGDALEWHLISRQSGELDLNSVEDEVGRFVRSLSGPDGSEEHPPSYQVEISKKHFSWGADATVVQIVLGVAAWAAASGSWDLLKMFSRRVGAQIRGERAPILVVTQEEAVATAKQIIYSRYSVPPDTLKMVSVGEDENASVVAVTLSDSNGVTYECAVSSMDEVIAVVRIIRTFSDDLAE